jgi:hypothetical protein
MMRQTARTAGVDVFLRLTHYGGMSTLGDIALARLLGQGDEVYLTPQNFIEF